MQKNKGLKNKKQKRLQSGQSLVEYAILIFIMSGISLTLFRTYKTLFQDGFQVLTAEVEKSLVTGDFTVKGGRNCHEGLWVR